MKVIITGNKKEGVLKTIKLENDYDLYALDLSGVTRHDQYIHLVYEDEYIYQSLFIEKDKKTKWYKMRIANIDMVHDIVNTNKEFVNMSFNSLQEFKDKIKGIWKIGEKSDTQSIYKCFSER